MTLYLLGLALLGLLAPLVPAAPSPRIQKRSFKVNRLRNENFQGHNGPRQLLKAYRKYSLPIPDGLEDAAEQETQRRLKRGIMLKSTNPNAKAANVGAVAATPELGDAEYLSPINIGGQTINVDFDSGSADLWVFSTELPKGSTAGHQLFNISKSKTFKTVPNESFTIKYGDGSTAAGSVGTDTVEVGGVTVTNQAVGVATSVSPAFVADVPNNGLFGLAFSKLNQVKPTKQKTFFDNVMSSLAEPLWTADLRKGSVGAYEFGHIDNTKHTEDLTWIPSDTEDGFWSFSTSGYSVGNDTSGLTKVAEGRAIADTGTTLMVVTQEVADKYYSQVPGSKYVAHLGGVTFPCDSKLPDLFLDVGGVYTAKIRAADIYFARLKGDGKDVFSIPSSYLQKTNLETEICYGGIQATTSTQQIWGDVFFRSQFVVFHGGNHSLGMAPHS
ncbi:aspartic peptidase domain-containing protein [Apiosordaria backusii]|uniref:Aspartic peptidase domain-containing protein n=1 Tax=Apiosordaria backusii TaxID=314023 RepID=A0AA40BLD4_9PEZI|nr:aspartic peptidase domain-containing protein [Apiosordaria backusii]